LAIKKLRGEGPVAVLSAGILKKKVGWGCAKYSSVPGRKSRLSDRTIKVGKNLSCKEVTAFQVIADRRNRNHQGRGKKKKTRIRMNRINGK